MTKITVSTNRNWINKTNSLLKFIEAGLAKHIPCRGMHSIDEINFSL